MSTALQPFVPNNLAELYSLCDYLAKSDLMPEALRGKPANCAIVIMTGHELGLGPMLSARTINVIKGKSSLSADLMGALVQRSPVCEYFMPVESTATQATYETKRRGHPKPVRLSWTMKQAQAAGLTSQPNYRAYPEAMLRARCEAALARMVYPDIVAGIYDPDELGAPTEPASTYIDATVVETATTDTPRVEEFGSRVEDLTAQIDAAQMQADLDALKPYIKDLEPSHPEAYKQLVAYWRARETAIAPPPTRTDALKAKMRKAAAPVEPKTISVVGEDGQPIETGGEK
jgi:hypothetical protein